jgi:hypothetical protein
MPTLLKYCHLPLPYRHARFLTATIAIYGILSSFMLHHVAIFCMQFHPSSAAATLCCPTRSLVRTIFLQACSDSELMDWVKQLHQCGCRLRSPNAQILLFRPATVGDGDRGYLLAPVAHKQGYLSKRGRLNTAFQVWAPALALMTLCRDAVDTRSLTNIHFLE